MNNEKNIKTQLLATQNHVKNMLNSDGKTIIPKETLQIHKVS